MAGLLAKQKEINRSHTLMQTEFSKSHRVTQKEVKKSHRVKTKEKSQKVNQNYTLYQYK